MTSRRTAVLTGAIDAIHAMQEMKGSSAKSIQDFMRTYPFPGMSKNVHSPTLHKVLDMAVKDDILRCDKGRYKIASKSVLRKLQEDDFAKGGTDDHSLGPMVDKCRRKKRRRRSCRKRRRRSCRRRRRRSCRKRRRRRSCRKRRRRSCRRRRRRSCRRRRRRSCRRRRRRSSCRRKRRCRTGEDNEDAARPRRRKSEEPRRRRKAEDAMERSGRALKQKPEGEAAAVGAPQGTEGGLKVQKRRRHDDVLPDICGEAQFDQGAAASGGASTSEERPQ